MISGLDLAKDLKQEADKAFRKGGGARMLLCLFLSNAACLSGSAQDSPACPIGLWGHTFLIVEHTMRRPMNLILAKKQATG